MTKVRILITGSRSWTDGPWIARELDSAAADAGAERVEDVTLVSGACPYGADYLAEQHATLRGWIVERHPADWAGLGKRAGFARNQTMVNLGADVCCTFVRNESAGATHTGRAAEAAGIPVRWYRRYDRG